MRNHILAVLAASPILLFGPGGHCQDSSETALGDPTPQAVQDPSLRTSRYFPPSLGTAGTAAIAPSAKADHAATCSPNNPCALPTPARDRVTVAQDKS